ncbi:hypothetical protein [Thiomicrorhabdus aquaedulcis]|nr:hypothetical protein [Thiomicrorhabdus aquaedulcis]
MTSLIIGSLVVLLVGGFLTGFALWLLKIANEKEKEEKQLEAFKNAS